MKRIKEVDFSNPSYYKDKKIEVIDCIESLIEGLPSAEAFNTGQVVKYLSRYNQKNGMQDLVKANWYLTRLTKLFGGR